MKKLPFTYASRKEINVELECFEGLIPNDLSGFAFFNSPVGTVNNETPIPKFNPDGSKNQEYAQMIFNGDGMILRFDFSNAGKIRLKTGLLRTPCYYADYNSRLGTAYYKEGMHFSSHGLTRMSGKLGVRNQINTSINAFKFGSKGGTRLTANFDAGRPFEFDPESLEVITPIGYNHEWRHEFPTMFKQTFEMAQSTAHPSFDPITQEFFTVCFLKSLTNLAFSEKLEHYLDNKLENFAQVFKEKIHGFWDNILGRKHLKSHHYIPVMKDLLGHISAQVENPDLEDYSKNQLQALLMKDTSKNGDPLGMGNAVRLKKWIGKEGIKTWNVIDEEGNNIVINQTMHQTSLSKDYIILVDTSVKFSLDIIEDNFFTDIKVINDVIRWFATKAIEPNTPLYLIKRADLQPENRNVIAKKIMIDIETVHFSVEYENPNDIITMHASHNSALCAAEWVRPYDTLAVSDEPVHENTLGLMVCGEMDISRVGKWRIDGKTAKIIESKKVHRKGFEGDDPSKINSPHTWAVGLSTFRDMISADKVTPNIPYVFWQFYGLDYRMLTNFIKNLYTQYDNRIIEVEDLLNYYRKGVPFCLSRQNTETMEFDDFYLFKMNENLRSLQFVPRKRSGEDPSEIEAAIDGYIVCTMVNGKEDFSGDEYTREVWIFDAGNLKKGPLCKLHHPDMQFAFTIHSIWIEDCNPSPRDYMVDVITDYLEVIGNYKDEKYKQKITRFFEDTVFPYYKQK